MAVSGAGGARRSASAGGNMRLLAVGIAVLVVALVAIDALALTIVNPATRLGPHYYMSLGDSVAFGFQPDLNFSDGFANFVFQDLHKAQSAPVTDLANFACAGESSATMIAGECRGRALKHIAYTGPQLDAAIAFLKRHPGQVNPITLDMGANDVITDFDHASCTAAPTSDADLATLDRNLTQTILPRLQQAIRDTSGPRGADIVLLNYYNPFAKDCPGSNVFTHKLNDHLAADADQAHVRLVDVYAEFGGDAHMADNICTLTWICDARQPDIHPHTLGYQKIRDAVERTLAYPGIGSPQPLPIVAPFGRLLAPREGLRPSRA